MSYTPNSIGDITPQNIPLVDGDSTQVAFGKTQGQIDELFARQLQVNLLNQSGAYTLADFTSAEKMKEGFSRAWVIHPDGATLSVPSSWLNVGDNVFSTVNNNEVMAYVLNKKVRYTIVYSTLELVVPDVTPPSFVSASINTAGTIITVIFNEDVAGTSNITVVGKVVTLATFSGPSVLLTFNTPFVTGDTITMNGGTTITDLSSNAFAGFTSQNVVNTVPLPDTTAPVITGIAVNTLGTTITDTYNETLDNTSVPAGSAYVVSNGATIAVTSITIVGATVIKTLASPILSGQSVTQVYTSPASNKVRDLSGNNAASHSSGVSGVPSVVNNSTVTIVFSDAFTGADTSSIIGRTPPVGGVWIRHANTSAFPNVFGIVSNDAKLASTGAAYNGSQINKYNLDVELVIGAITTGGSLIIAESDDSNSVGLVIATGLVFQKIAGANTTKVAASGTTVANDILRILKNGTTVTVFRNGVVIGTGTLDSNFSSGVRFYISCSDTTLIIKSINIVAP